jgi:hypothetical protein
MKFPSLKVLEFHEPPSIPKTMKLSVEETDIYMDAVASTLLHVPLPSLRELKVQFAVTHDFGLFFPSDTRLDHIPIEMSYDIFDISGCVLTNLPIHRSEKTQKEWDTQFCQYTRPVRTARIPAECLKCLKTRRFLNLSQYKIVTF